MKTNTYESAVIINAALEDQQIEAEISRIKDTITVNGGEITEIDNWGRKRLAYAIEKSKTGYYVIFKFQAPSNLVAKLERFYTLNEYILRFLTIKLSKDALEYFEKSKILAAERAKAEEEENAAKISENAQVSSENANMTEGKE